MCQCERSHRSRAYLCPLAGVSRSRLVKSSEKTRFSRGPCKPFEMLLGVGGEVEVELRDRQLHDTPHRLPEVRHEPHQDEGISLVAAVGREQCMLGLFGERVIDGKVAVIQHWVAHTGVFPVDEPEAET